LLSDGFDVRTYAWYYPTENSPYGSKEVATLIPNAFGIYDMSGNLYEWIHDNYINNLGTSNQTDPVWDNGSQYRVTHGGSWKNHVNSLRSANRSFTGSFGRGYALGFRVGRTDNAGTPSAPEISLSPASPTEGIYDVVCVIDTESVDPDGNSITYTFSWTVDGVDYTGTPSTTTKNGDTIDSSETNAGALWECTVTPNDGTEDGYTGTASVVIKACTGYQTDCHDSIDLGGGQGIDFVNIEAGTFMMGSPSSEVGRESSEDLHEVTLSKDFLLSTTEITQGMYYQLMGYQAYDGENSDYGAGTDYPAYFVSWHMAADFSNQLTQQHNSLQGTSLEECYSCIDSGSTSVVCSTAVQPIYDCTGYRFPTEAEWEYAARAGTTAAIWTPNGGGNIPSGYEGLSGCSLSWTLSDGSTLGDLGWFCANNQWNNASYPLGSKEVATKIPNDNGLYDMRGNLWEWIQDMQTGPLGTGATTDPVGYNPNYSSFYRMIRGGFWGERAHALRSAMRNDRLPDYRSKGVGFRPARTR